MYSYGVNSYGLYRYGLSGAWRAVEQDGEAHGVQHRAQMHSESAPMHDVGAWARQIAPVRWIAPVWRIAPTPRNFFWSHSFFNACINTRVRSRIHAYICTGTCIGTCIGHVHMHARLEVSCVLLCTHLSWATHSEPFVLSAMSRARFSQVSSRIICAQYFARYCVQHCSIHFISCRVQHCTRYRAQHCTGAHPVLYPVLLC